MIEQVEYCCAGSEFCISVPFTGVDHEKIPSEKSVRSICVDMIQAPRCNDDEF